MSGPAKVFLHVGLHKTGTTFLQNLFRANIGGLASEGVDFPWGPDEPVQTFAVWDLQGRRPRGAKDPRIAGQWQVLADRVNASKQPTVLISEERLSISTFKQARAAIEPFQDRDVQIIVTSRDLARMAVSSWQEEVKNDHTLSWQDYSDAIKDPERLTQNPARGFWMRQELCRVLEIWATALSVDRVHLVTVPPSGGDPGTLTARFSSLVGFDPAALDQPPKWNNETVGVAGIEVIRQLNLRLGGRLNQIQYDMLVKRTIVRMLASRDDTVRFGLPDEDLPWIAERSEEWIKEIEERGYDVVGDLDDLRPRASTGGRHPSDVSQAELLEASLDALALLAEDYSQKWWMRRRRKLDAVEEEQSLGSKRRALVYKSQLRAAHVADHNAFAAKLMGVVLKSRDRAVQRARKDQ